jgi:hypothetical protein
MGLADETLLLHHFSASSLYTATGMNTTLVGYAVAKRRHALVLSVYKVLLTARRGLSFISSCGAESLHFWIAVGSNPRVKSAFAGIVVSEFLRATTLPLKLSRKAVYPAAYMLWKSTLRPGLFLKWTAGSLTNYRKVSNRLVGKYKRKTREGLLTSRRFPSFLLSLTPRTSSVALREASIFGIPSLGLVDPTHGSYAGDATFSVIAPAGGFSIAFVFCTEVLDGYYSAFARETQSMRPSILI